MSEIEHPSDLFGFEILSEHTYESQYGKLTFNSILVPDFSKDEIGLNRLKEEFENIKTFIADNDLKKKLEIAKKIYYNDINIDVFWGKLKKEKKSFSNFSGFLFSVIKARLFEEGISLRCDICTQFNYQDSNNLSKGIIEYNMCRIVQPFS